MEYLRQSTAVTKKIGPFLDDVDGNTEETELVIAQADIRLSKNGGDFAQKNEATSCTYDELGMYGCPLNVTDTGTLGGLQLCVHKSGALFVWRDYTVITANAYDSLFSTEHLDVNVAEISDDSAAANNLEAALENGVAGYVASDCKKYNGKTTVTSVAGSLPNVNIDRVNDSGGAAENLATNIGDLDTSISSRAPANEYDTQLDANMSTRSSHDAAAVKTALEAEGSNLDELHDLISDSKLPAQIKGTDNIDFSTIQKTSLNNATPAVTVSDKTGFSLSTAGILAIWHQLTAAIVTASTIGKLVVDYLNASVSSRATSAALTTHDGKLDTVDTVVDAIKAKTDNLPSDPADASVVAGLIATAQSDLDIITGGNGALIDTDAIDADAIKADAVTEIQSGLATTAALTTHDGKLDTVDTVVDAIKAKADQLNFTGDDVKATLDSETVSVGDKTGFKLASDGLDSVSTTDPSGLASNFREMIVQLFGRFFYKLTADSSEITTHKADDNANTDQAISTVGEIKTVNKAVAAS